MKNYWKKHLMSVKNSQDDRENHDCVVERQKQRVQSRKHLSRDGTVDEKKASIVAPVKINNSIPDKPQRCSDEKGKYLSTESESSLSA